MWDRLLICGRLLIGREVRNFIYGRLPIGRRLPTWLPTCPTFTCSCIRQTPRGSDLIFLPPYPSLPHTQRYAASDCRLTSHPAPTQSAFPPMRMHSGRLAGHADGLFSAARVLGPRRTYRPIPAPAALTGSLLPRSL